MTQPHPQRCYEIREDELIDVFAFLHDAPDFIQEIEGDIREHPCVTHTPAAPATDETEIVKAITDAFDRGYAVAMADIEGMGKEKERDCIKRIKAGRERVLDEFLGKLIYFFEEEAEGMLRGLPLFSEVDALSPKQVMQWIQSLRGGD